MSVSTRNPIRMIGGQPFSGGPNTGEFQHVRGGSVAVSFYSGAVAPGVTGGQGAVAVGSDVMIYSGAGRLNSVMPHVQMVSGLAVFFYDGIAAISGGPLAASGHQIIGVIPPTYGGSFVSGGAVPAPTGQPINIDMPFRNGLCFNSRSGQPGFTLSYTPEVVPTLPV